jgi:hypothetical protein
MRATITMLSLGGLLMFGTACASNPATSTVGAEPSVQAGPAQQEEAALKEAERKRRMERFMYNFENCPDCWMHEEWD